MKLLNAVKYLVMSGLILSGAAFAQEAPRVELPKEEIKPMVDVSGVLYIWYQADQKNEAAPNPVTQQKGDHFTLNRGYITFAKKFDEVWSVRVTTDVSSGAKTDGTGENRVFIKNAYLQMRQDFDPVVFTIQYGLVGTPITGLIDKVADVRWIYNSYIDKSKDLINETLDPTADMGIKGEMEIMKMVTLTGMYSNGEGYSKGFSEAEGDFSKAYYGMLTVNPIKGLYLAGFYKNLMNSSRVDATSVTSVTHPASDWNSGNYLTYYGAALAWSDNIFKVGGDYSMIRQNISTDATNPKKKGKLYDVWAMINLGDLTGVPVLLYGRYASGELKNANPVSGEVDASGNSTAGGLGYQFNKNVRVLAMYEVVDKKWLSGKDETFWVKTEVKF